MLKGNDTELSDAENILFGPKYEELVGKSLSSKNLWFYKNSRIVQGGK